MMMMTRYVDGSFDNDDYDDYDDDEDDADDADKYMQVMKVVVGEESLTADN